MAEELQYGSDSLSNKRKYEDSQAALPSRSRPTGFSAPISSQSPPDSKQPPAYNSVPPPMDEIQLAKQKAQEIAARLFNNVDPSKKPRVDNGGSGGYDSIERTTFSLYFFVFLQIFFLKFLLCLSPLWQASL